MWELINILESIKGKSKEKNLLDLKELRVSADLQLGGTLFQICG